MFENHAYDEVLANKNFDHFASLGVQFTDYYAITHPSQPNYFCQTGGSFFGWNSDNPINLDDSNIVDLLAAKHISWKSYQQDYPGDCNSAEFIGYYARKHNPFMSYNNIRNNATRCAKIVPATQLDTDLENPESLPQLMYFTPNLLNDAHNTNITYAGEWLRPFLDARYPKFPKGTLFFITWDEDDFTESNHIDSAMFGSMVPAGKKEGKYYNHYSLLRTIEDNWDLGTLGRNDKHASPFFPLQTEGNTISAQ